MTRVGASDSSKGDYSIELLGGDVLAIADAAGLAQFPFWASLRNVRSAQEYQRVLPNTLWQSSSQEIQLISRRRFS